MKKIGILTYHNNGNRGSILQAYCLAKSLAGNIDNSEVEIIDYRSFSKEIRRLFGKTIYRKTPIIFLKRLADYDVCTKFFRKKQILSSEKIITDKYKKAIDFLKNQDYDMIVVGSDTIWNLRKENGILPTTRPFPNPYFLNPNLECLKVSYAASVGSTDYKDLSKNKTETYKKHLSSFDKISIRDEHTENFLNKLGISKSKITRVPDPTILVDLPDSDPTDTLARLGISLDKPILAINRCGELTKEIIDVYKGKGYQIVAPYKGNHSDVELFTDITPLEYYSVHGCFDFVVSGSLHTTIFSIKNGTPFATLDFSDSNLIDKKETLLKEFNLLNRHIKVSDNDDSKDILEKIEKCEKDLDEKSIQRRLDQMKEKGLKYIEELGEMLDEKD